LVLVLLSAVAVDCVGAGAVEVVVQLKAVGFVLMQEQDGKE
jgi:hypothetical protein